VLRPTFLKKACFKKIIKKGVFFLKNFIF